MADPQPGTASNTTRGADTRFSPEAEPGPSNAPTERFVPLTSRVTSTANTPNPGVGHHASAGAASSAIDERGSLSIEDTVVEKVAVAAASEIDGVGGAARRILGIPTGSDHGEDAPDRRPRVSARVVGQTAALEVRLTVAYPASVRAATEAVRAHVRDRVTALTELRVTRVDITVAALTHTTAPTRRTLQ